MAIRKNDVYRGKKSKAGFFRSFLFFLAIVLIIIMVLFYALQKYVVYEQDGISVVLPLSGTSSTTDIFEDRTFDTVEANLSISALDYSSIEASGGTYIGEMKALFVPSDYVNDDGINKFYNLMGSYNSNGLALEVKPVSGQLVYNSEVEMAVNYGLSGTYDLATKVYNLKADGVYLAAVISCSIDSSLATKNSTVGLLTGYGTTYSDTNGMWVDPYNTYVREYISDLALELLDMGFDEVILTNLVHPDTYDSLTYSQLHSIEPDKTRAVSGFALAVTEAVGDAGFVSVMVSEEVLHGDGTVTYGQDFELFYKVFDRVIGYADSAWQYGVDSTTFEAYEQTGYFGYRYIPYIYYAPDTASSWLIDVDESMLADEE